MVAGPITLRCGHARHYRLYRCPRANLYLDKPTAQEQDSITPAPPSCAVLLLIHLKHCRFINFPTGLLQVQNFTEALRHHLTKLAEELIVDFPSFCTLDIKIFR
jgi:hypothetical protein